MGEWDAATESCFVNYCMGANGSRVILSRFEIDLVFRPRALRRQLRRWMPQMKVNTYAFLFEFVKFGRILTL